MSFLNWYFELFVKMAERHGWQVFQSSQGWVCMVCGKYAIEIHLDYDNLILRRQRLSIEDYKQLFG